MAANEAYTDILSGKMDGDLDRIEQAIKERQRTLAARLYDDLQIGDKVKMTGGKNYLVGAVGTVVEKRITKVTVEFPEDMPHEHDPYGKWAGRRAICPASILEKVA